MPGSHLRERPEKKRDELDINGKRQHTLGLTAMVVVTLGIRTHRYTSIRVMSGDTQATYFPTTVRGIDHLSNSSFVFLMSRARAN